jgi:6-phosphogluconolactonase/glucosamine-6-phosphate isomerase/deaminase
MDGHFASLFPDQLTDLRILDVNALPALVKSEQPLGSPCYQRISMNLSLLTDTKRCILIVPSEEKRVVIKQAYGDNRLPLYFLLNQKKTTVEFSDLDFT